MPEGRERPVLLARFASAFAEICPQDWDACAGVQNPFVSYGFLSALEVSQSAVAASGWQPIPMIVCEGGGRVLACAPCYLKSHSLGEYVFDGSWAQAYERAGGHYYPKLQVAVPFSPVSGPRLLIHTEAPPEAQDVLVRGLIQLGRQTGVSSIHVTFPTASHAHELEARGFLVREGTQFQWLNRGYRCFEEFLGALNSRKRKAIRRERAAVSDQGIRFQVLVGSEIRDRHWNAFARFYRYTVDRKWAHAYLTDEFFHELGTRLGDRVLLIVAETTAGEPVAGALNLIGEDALFGRNWGCAESYRFLHFETCYYRAIEFAIERGLARVEAGAQGEHKIARGYLPVPTWSAHWIADEGFRRAVARFLASERAAVQRQRQELLAHSPYRRNGQE